MNFIKRVVAGPGDRICDRGRPRRSSTASAQKEPFIRALRRRARDATSRRRSPFPPDHYFMMGDNRGSSDDSRFWGPVPENWIIGEAFATYWPPKRIGLL